MADKKVTEVYIINTLEGRVQIEPGTQCAVVSETDNEATIFYPHGLNVECREAIVPKIALGLDMSHLDILTDKPSYRA